MRKYVLFLLLILALGTPSQWTKCSHGSSDGVLYSADQLPVTANSDKIFVIQQTKDIK